MKTTQKGTWILLCIGFLLAVGAVTAIGEEGGTTVPPAYRVLVVDGTKTLSSTMRLVGLASGIEQSGLADVTVLLADDLGSFDDPLEDRLAPEQPYDLILLVPRGVDDGTAYALWMLVGGDPNAAAGVAQALSLLGAGIETAFAGTTAAMGPTDDLWAALTAALYVQEGWLE